jgi:hypothetical protein
VDIPTDGVEDGGDVLACSVGEGLQLDDSLFLISG